MIDTNYYVMLSYNQGYLPAKGVSKMKILFAVSDRDFLSSFAKLFEISGYETDTTFDGAQTLRKISETAFDLVRRDNTDSSGKGYTCHCDFGKEYILVNASRQ